MIKTFGLRFILTALLITGSLAVGGGVLINTLGSAETTSISHCGSKP